MRGLRLDRVLAGTALALVQVGLLASGNFDARAQSPAADRKEIEALVPLPDAADVPPPTFGDFSRVPLPDPVPVGAIVAPAPAQPAEGPAAGSTATASPPPATEPPAAEAKEPPTEPAKPGSAPGIGPPPIAPSARSCAPCSPRRTTASSIARKSVPRSRPSMRGAATRRSGSRTGSPMTAPRPRSRG